MIYIGIDPGKSGGIAAVWPNRMICRAERMPSTEGDVLALLTQLVDAGMESGGDPGCFAVLERVASSPQMGVVSAFTFGQGYGALRMALHAAGIPFDAVTPGKWQQLMGCRSKGDKNVTKRRAQELWPRFAVTHATADALLLADYARRTEAVTRRTRR